MELRRLKSRTGTFSHLVEKLPEGVKPRAEMNRRHKRVDIVLVMGGYTLNLSQQEAFDLVAAIEAGEEQAAIKEHQLGLADHGLGETGGDAK